jgi:CHAT domain-containing protein
MQVEMLVQQAGTDPNSIALHATAENADELVTRLKAEVDRHWWIDAQISIRYADAIIRVGQALTDSRIVALGMMAKGDSLRIAGQIRAAWDLLNEAGALFRAIGNEVGWARTRIGRLPIAVELDFGEQALQEAEQAAAIFRAHGERDLLMRLEINRVVPYDLLGQHKAALEAGQRAKDLAVQLGDSAHRFLGHIYTNLGYSYTFLGDLSAARDQHEAALEWYRQNGEKTGIALAEMNLAYLDQIQGRYQEALRRLYWVEEQFADTMPVEHARTRNVITQCFLSLNRWKEARAMAGETVTRCADLGILHDEARALCQLATAEARLGNPEAALKALERAGAIFRDLEADSWLGTVHLQQSQIALYMGYAEQAAEEARKAISHFEQHNRHINAVESRLAYGQALHNQRQYTQAAQMVDAVLNDSGAYLQTLHYQGHLLLGRIFHEQGERERARLHYQQAVDRLDQIQRTLMMTLRSDYMQDKIEPTQALIRMALEDGQAADALRTLEHAKAQTLLGYLANRESLYWSVETPEDMALLQTLQTLRQEHHMYYRMAHEQQDKPLPHLTSDQLAAEIATRERQIQHIIEQLYLRSPTMQHTMSLPDLDQIQAALPCGSAMIEYWNDGAALYAFVLTPERVTVERLPMPMDELNRLIDQHRFHIDSALKLGATDAGRMTPIYERLMRKFEMGLFAPLKPLIAGCEHLIIVPYGVLHYLPFNLLYDGEHYLIECCDVSILPMGGLISRPPVQRQRGMLLLAHSFEGRLPGVLQEADALAGILPGEVYRDDEVTSARLKETPCQVLHLGAHGEYRMDQPALSYVRLADGQLYTDDLLQNDLSYELITLSACETGRAEIGPGDELIGLGRGFLIAGAGAVAASLWRVPDSATVQLMTRFYQGLAAGNSKVRALRCAQRALRHLHPAFWGAFQLVGDSHPLSRERHS